MDRIPHTRKRWRRAKLSRVGGETARHNHREKIQDFQTECMIHQFELHRKGDLVLCGFVCLQEARQTTFVCGDFGGASGGNPRTELNLDLRVRRSITSGLHT